MLQAPKRILLLICAVIGVAGLVNFFAPRVRQYIIEQQKSYPRIEGIGLVPVVTFSDLPKSLPIVATVQSRKVKITNAIVGVTSEMLNAFATSPDYIAVSLISSDGKKFSIEQEKPGPNIVSFVMHLREGKKYNLPEEFRKWEHNPGK